MVDVICEMKVGMMKKNNKAQNPWNSSGESEPEKSKSGRRSVEKQFTKLDRETSLSERRSCWSRQRRSRECAQSPTEINRTILWDVLDFTGRCSVYPIC